MEPNVRESRYLPELKRELDYWEAKAARILKTNHQIGERCMENTLGLQFPFFS